ncbi:MAG: outer membrane protein assembly factor BamD [Proteobacteria bacterium]|nr:outer membrane protein assembly factor BamD [Pseudomonadota bacterium]NCA28790.1 outer membrane protein assembly factor BamD [Pseudomonadota bacterium]
MKKIFIKIFLVFFLTNLSGCKSSEKIVTAESLYLEAFELLQDKDYMLSAEAFEKIDNEFPYTKWAIKGQTMSAYANYRLREYDKVIQLADDFIKLHSNSEYAPYMLYMKGLGYYNKIPSIERAQDFTKEASLAFRELVARYRESQFSLDAKEKINFIDEHLAGAKLSTARHQIYSQNYVGAIKHLNEAITLFHYTKQTPEAYYRLAEIYFRIGMKDQSKTISEYLQKKFPKNYWSKESLKFISPKPNLLTENAS